jgi:hypothetical protein
LKLPYILHTYISEQKFRNFILSSIQNSQAQKDKMDSSGLRGPLCIETPLVVQDSGDIKLSSVRQLVEEGYRLIEHDR